MRGGDRRGGEARSPVSAAGGEAVTPDPGPRPLALLPDSTSLVMFWLKTALHGA